MKTIRRTLAQIIYERTPRMCPICEEVWVLGPTGVCSECYLTAHQVKPLDRATVLAGFDPDEYVPPGLDCEAVA